MSLCDTGAHGSCFVQSWPCSSNMECSFVQCSSAFLNTALEEEDVAGAVGSSAQ